jgi:hypothetical protein
MALDLESMVAVRLQKGRFSNVQEAAKEMLLPKSALWNYARSKKVDANEMVRHGVKVARHLQQVRQHIADGISTVSELKAIGRLSEDEIKKYLELIEVQLPKPPPEAIHSTNNSAYTPTHGCIDSLLQQGFDINTILAKLPFNSTIKTKQGVHIYIKTSGQIDVWKGAKKRRKSAAKEECAKLRELRQTTVNVIIGHLYNRAQKEENWALTKSLEYHFAGGISDYLVHVLPLLETFKVAKDERKRLSFSELAKAGKLRWGSEAYKIIIAVGEKSLYWECASYTSIISEQEEAIKRAFFINMGFPDIAYFCSVSPQTIYHRFKKSGGRQKNHPIIRLSDRKFLTYRLASQIYEAKHAGFTIDETAEVLDTTREAVSVALENKDTIGERIKGALDTLYPEKEILFPFLLK